MAAMLQHSPVVPRAKQQQQQQHTHLQKVSPDFVVNSYPNGKKRTNQQNQEPWSYPHDWQKQPFTNNAYHYSSYQQYPPPPHMYHSSQPRPHRPRTQSNPTQSNVLPQKSSSTPNSHQRQQRNRRPSNQTISTDSPRRPKSMLMQQPSSARPILMPSASSSNRSISTADSGRRSSITSTSSNASQSFSIRSDMSMGTKLSFSKRLRKVFSVSSLRSSSSSKSIGSLGGASSSNVSIATVDMIPEEYSDSSTSSPITPSTPPQRSLRRRSLASLSNLFHKSAPQPPQPLPLPQSFSPAPRRPSSIQQSVIASADKKNRPSLRVDTTQPSIPSTSVSSSSSTSSSSSARKTPFKGRSPVVAPDSPNSGISTRPAGPHRLASELPSPTPSSSSSSSSQADNEMNTLVARFGDLAMAPPPVIGVHYGLPMHGSPRLKPAASSSSSSLLDQVTPLPSSSKRRLQFCPTVQVHETFAAADYDRRCDNNATCQKLTPSLALKIKQEMNEYKLTEMDVHIDSRQYTQFFL